MPDQSQKVIVDVREVSKTYRQVGITVEALKNVNFQARSGEILLIVGPSGSGKTTLLCTIAGTLRYDTGDIEIFNTSLNHLTNNEVTDFRKRNVGFIFQRFHLIKPLTCVENVSIPLILNGYKREEAEERAAIVLQKVGLKGKEYVKPTQLSGGQEQRVAIARALVHEPPLVICDEPTSNLDAETGATILELLREVARAPGRSVIIVTHDTRIFKYGDRIAKMDDGRIVSIEEVSHDHHS